uniref:FAD dependent oxidoreductase domain-containing protein n=1 Tax=Noctiluca scintillans TaxID=2966 RepID=A0A6T9DBC0_NOCSC
MADTELGNVIIAGAGLHGAALAYYLTKRGVKPILVECHCVAGAASGKGGGFLARNWGSGATDQLHKVSFKLHEELAAELGITSYRRISVLSVQPGKRKRSTANLCPWLDGDIADASWMDKDGAAQVAPHELCTKLVEAAVAGGASLRIGTVQGVRTEPAGAGTLRELRGVVVDGEVLPARKFVVTMGPWSALASQWFDLPVPMTGIKSTSVIFKAGDVEPVALFCGEDDRFGTHLEVYPRSSGEVYLCGVGGSEHVDGARLVAGEYPPGEVHADPARVEAATAAFSTMSKTLGGTPETSQACMRPCTRDGIPLMGKVPHVKGAYMSCGHNCWGILWAPVSGLAMSELLLDGQARCVDLSAFNPARFQRRREGARGRKRGEDDVGEQW